LLFERLSQRPVAHKATLLTLAKIKGALAKRDAPSATFPAVSASEMLFLRINSASISFSGEPSLFQRKQWEVDACSGEGRRGGD